LDNNNIFNPVAKKCTWQNILYETRKKIKRKRAGRKILAIKPVEIGISSKIAFSRKLESEIDNTRNVKQCNKA
jgi:hypothetical protein